MFLSLLQWECKADLESSYRFGEIEVSCEGYDYPGDPYILEGSCGLLFSLELTEEGERRAKGSAGFGSGYYQPRKDSLDSVPGVVVVLVLLALAYGVYRLFLSNQQPPQSFGDSFSRPSWQGRQAPPPPGFKATFTERSRSRRISAPGPTTGLRRPRAGSRAVPRGPAARERELLLAPGTPESAEERGRGGKSKPFRCKPCQYEAECEEQFVHHIRVHSAKKFFVEESAEKQAQAKEAEAAAGAAEEVDFSKGPIRCDRCGYNTNRYDHYLAHLKHHNKAGENERVYKCTICTYTTVSEYHWKKHLRNHFPRKVYTCSQCSYFSDRKNNYIQHIRTHTGRPFPCARCVAGTRPSQPWPTRAGGPGPGVPSPALHRCQETPGVPLDAGGAPWGSLVASGTPLGLGESGSTQRRWRFPMGIRAWRSFPFLFLSVYLLPPLSVSIFPGSSYFSPALCLVITTFPPSPAPSPGEKPFKCDQCSYVASNQHEVTRHARQVHNGPKPLTCPHCDYKTADRSNFKKHVELHVNPRQFLCPVCDYAASKKCNLQYHIKSRHPDCSDITMDVSKVKLRTKKSEADFSESLSDKAEKEQAKGDSAAKKTEKTVKVEKKENLAKEKKPTSSVCVGQVTTRSRKSASENKEVDIKTERSTEKPCKAKKSKRKAEAEAASSKDEPANDTPAVMKKKKKVETKPRDCQEAPKSDVVAEEEPRKQNSCPKKNRKKKALKSKHGKKSSKPDAEALEEEQSRMEGPAASAEDPPAPGSPCAGRTATSDSQEVDEDEGIHSHEGSDISDNISEGSDDSGLNGARSAPDDAGAKAGAGGAGESFVCIFCDRCFGKEGEYSKHLNRHLVNVYYLEKATKGQE
ncbi:PREDICTED: RE1-silencing transcription factor [Tinamus guttatus]|uniref:RE1-silencing transcription factor n=1 Tax=Tinamus guttatus TaxID=94827 RepID=UPI00052EDE91|nr:PREDICTED: RE1-silencing transcription factor [Tinamus guttatus]